MREPVDHGIRPIGQAIRTAERELSEAEWIGDEQASVRARNILASLKSQEARGEQYSVPF